MATSIWSPEWVKRQREKGRDILIVEATRKDVQACGKCLAIQGYRAKDRIASSPMRDEFYQWWEVVPNMKWSARREGVVPMAATPTPE